MGKIAMRNFHYVELDKLIKEYEEDSRTIRSERMVMKNYPKVLTMSVASSFEYNIKNRCQDFYDNPKLSIVPNYPKINALKRKRKPIVDQMYNRMKAYNDNGVEHLSADAFYELFNGEKFRLMVETIFDAKLRTQIQEVEEQIKNLTPLLDTNEQFAFEYAKQCDLKDAYEKCSFKDAEKAFLSLKLRRNQVAHNYVNGLSDTFNDIQKFYDIAVIYVVALEETIEKLTNT